MTTPALPTKVADIAEVSGGLTKNARRESHFFRRPYLTVANVYANQLELNDVGTIGLSPSELPRVELRTGDLLVVEGNGSLSQVGRVALWSGAIPGCVHQNHLIKVRPGPHVRSKWLLYWLLSPRGRRTIEAVASSTSGLHTLSISKVGSLPVPAVPNLPIQDTIVESIEMQTTRLDAAVASLKRAKANVKRARASVLQAAVEGRLVPTEAALARAEGRDYEPASALLERILAKHSAAWNENNGRGRYEEPSPPANEHTPELPAGWTYASMNQLLAYVTSGSRGWAQYYSENGSAFVRIGDLRRGSLQVGWRTAQRVQIPTSAEGSRTRIRPGDLLVSITADLGVIGLVPADVAEAYVNQHIAIARPVDKATSSYLGWFLESEAGGQRQFRNLKRGATKAGLGLDDIRNVTVRLPPLAEQQRIVAEVDRRLSVLDALDATIDANLARCAQLRQSILQRAFSGQLVPAGEPVSA